MMIKIKYQISKIKNIENSLRNKTGFTLIELMIVIVIIGMLSGISIFALQGARQQGRDARRKADLEAIRSAVELFKADCNVYPSSLPGSGSSLTGSAVLGCSPANTNVYIQSVPGEPSGGNYIYARLTTVTYELCATLEQPPVPPQPCGGGGNFRVRNP